MSQIEAYNYNSTYKYDMICISKTHFYSSISIEDRTIQLDEYNLIILVIQEGVVFASTKRSL